MAGKTIYEKSIKEIINDLKKGDLSSREILINHYKPTAKRIASEYFNLGLEKEEVIQSAYEGLILGINKLANGDCKENPQKHLYRNIEGTIEINILAFYGIYFDSYSVKSKHRIITKTIEVLKAKRDLKSILQRNPNVKEISDYLQKDIETVNEILKIISPNESIEYQELHTIKNESLNLENTLIKTMVEEELNQILKSCLNEQELQILYLQYIEKLTVREIGSILKISHARVGIIEEKIKKILNELKELIKNEDCIGIKYLEFKRKAPKDIMLLAKNGDKDAFNYLIQYYIPKAKKIASKYFETELPEEIILSFAYDGLKIGMTQITERLFDDCHSVLNYYINKTIKENLIKCGIDLTEVSKKKKLTQVN